VLVRLRSEQKTPPGFGIDDVLVYWGWLKSNYRHLEKELEKQGLNAEELVRRYDQFRQEQKQQGRDLPYEGVGSLIVWARKRLDELNVTGEDE